jgi:hypothetical protein
MVISARAGRVRPDAASGRLKGTITGNHNHLQPGLRLLFDAPCRIITGAAKVNCPFRRI